MNGNFAVTVLRPVLSCTEGFVYSPVVVHLCSTVFFFDSNVLCLKDLMTCEIANSPCPERFLPEPLPLMVLLVAWPAASQGAAVGKEAKARHGAGAKLWVSALLSAIQPPLPSCLLEPPDLCFRDKHFYNVSL